MRQFTTGTGFDNRHGTRYELPMADTFWQTQLNRSRVQAVVRSPVSQVGRVALEDRVESCLIDAACDGTAELVWGDLKWTFKLFQ